MSAGSVEKWLVEQADAGMAASTRNSYREAAVGFGNWCRRTHRLTHNPFVDLPRADPNVDRRHHRRALAEVELLSLLRVARLRPLVEYGREITPVEVDPERPSRSRATWKRKPLTVEIIDAAVERGREALRDKPDLIAQLERTRREDHYPVLAFADLASERLPRLLSRNTGRVRSLHGDEHRIVPGILVEACLHGQEPLEHLRRSNVADGRGVCQVADALRLDLAQTWAATTDVRRVALRQAQEEGLLTQGEADWMADLLAEPPECVDTLP